MKMNQEITELTTFTIEEFQNDFDNLMNRVEGGESFIISSEHGNAVIVPYNEVVQVFQESGMSDDLIRIHTDHEEGS
jgi:prevent-host-death family protein